MSYLASGGLLPQYTANSHRPQSVSLGTAASKEGFLDAGDHLHLLVLINYSNVDYLSSSKPLHFSHTFFFNVVKTGGNLLFPRLAHTNSPYVSAS